MRAAANSSGQVVRRASGQAIRSRQCCTCIQYGLVPGGFGQTLVPPIPCCIQIAISGLAACPTPMIYSHSLFSFADPANPIQSHRASWYQVHDLSEVNAIGSVEPLKLPWTRFPHEWGALRPIRTTTVCNETVYHGRLAWAAWIPLSSIAVKAYSINPEEPAEPGPEITQTQQCLIIELMPMYSDPTGVIYHQHYRPLGVWARVEIGGIATEEIEPFPAVLATDPQFRLRIFEGALLYEEPVADPADFLAAPIVIPNGLAPTCTANNRYWVPERMEGVWGGSITAVKSTGCPPPDTTLLCGGGTPGFSCPTGCRTLRIRITGEPGGLDVTVPLRKELCQWSGRSACSGEAVSVALGWSEEKEKWALTIAWTFDSAWHTWVYVQDGAEGTPPALTGWALDTISPPETMATIGFTLLCNDGAPIGDTPPVCATRCIILRVKVGSTVSYLVLNQSGCQWTGSDSRFAALVREVVGRGIIVRVTDSVTGWIAFYATDILHSDPCALNTTPAVVDGGEENVPGTGDPPQVQVINRPTCDCAQTPLDHYYVVEFLVDGRVGGVVDVLTTGEPSWFGERDAYKVEIFCEEDGMLRMEIRTGPGGSEDIWTYRGADWVHWDFVGKTAGAPDLTLIYTAWGMERVPGNAPSNCPTTIYSTVTGTDGGTYDGVDELTLLSGGTFWESPETIKAVLPSMTPTFRHRVVLQWFANAVIQYAVVEAWSDETHYTEGQTYVFARAARPGEPEGNCFWPNGWILVQVNGGLTSLAAQLTFSL